MIWYWDLHSERGVRFPFWGFEECKRSHLPQTALRLRYSRRQLTLILYYFSCVCDNALSTYTSSYTVLACCGKIYSLTYSGPSLRLHSLSNPGVLVCLVKESVSSRNSALRRGFIPKSNACRSMSDAASPCRISRPQRDPDRLPQIIGHHPAQRAVEI